MKNPYLTRYYNLDDFCLPGKVLLLFGARQVGKTTLIRHYLEQTSYKYKLDSGDNLSTQILLANADFRMIADYTAGYDLIVIDEAQRIKNIGLTLKIMVDEFPHLRIIVTGSSSFELTGQVGEPLTGRKKTLVLYPFAQLELHQEYNRHELRQKLDDYLIFGSYPAVITSNSILDKQEYITDIVNSYLLKDILELDKIKQPKILLDLLRLLVFQIGNEVSHHELAQKLSIDSKTVARYLGLLEKGFVIYNLRGFSRNLRKEISKKSKYYFYDTGIANALIANFNPLTMRDDIGRLWENFLFIERIKKLTYWREYYNLYFWRTWDQKEIDLIEEHGGKLHAFEFKWGNATPRAPKDWINTYPNSSFEIVNQDNYLEFIGVNK